MAWNAHRIAVDADVVVNNNALAAFVFSSRLSVDGYGIAINQNDHFFSLSLRFFLDDDFLFFAPFGGCLV